MDRVMEAAAREVERCKTRIKAMQEENKALQKRAKPSSIEENELRIREGLTNTLSRKFVEVFKEYQKAQKDYKDEVRRHPHTLPAPPPQHLPDPLV